MLDSLKGFNDTQNNFYNNLWNAGKEVEDDESTNNWAFVYESYSFESTLSDQIDELAISDKIDPAKVKAEEMLTTIESRKMIPESEEKDVVRQLITQAGRLIFHLNNSISSSNISQLAEFQRIVKGLITLVDDYGNLNALESLVELKGFMQRNPLSKGTVHQQFKSWFESTDFNLSVLKSSKKDLNQDEIKFIQMSMRLKIVTYLDTFNSEGTNTDLLKEIKDTDSFKNMESFFSETDKSDVMSANSIDDLIALFLNRLESMPESVEQIPLSEIEGSSILN